MGDPGVALRPGGRGAPAHSAHGGGSQAPGREPCPRRDCVTGGPSADFKVSAARGDGKNGLQTAKAKYTCKKETCLNRSPGNMCENVSLMALRAVRVEVDPGQGSNRGERPVQSAVLTRHSLHETERSSFLWAVLIKSNHPIKTIINQDIRETSQKPSPAVT